MKSFFAVAFLLLVVNSTAFAEEKAGVPHFPAPPQTPVKEMPAGEYKGDVDHTQVYWMFDHMGYAKYVVMFNKVDATLNFDPADPTKSKVVVKIDPRSAHSSSKDFNEKMQKVPFWFQPEKHPEITFVSTKVEKTGKDKGFLHGDLTIKGITKPVKLDAVFTRAVKSSPPHNLDIVAFRAKVVLKRSDFDMDAFTPAVPDEIPVFIEVEFARPGAEKKADEKKDHK